MAHVFISYKREDRAFVSLLEEKIKESGMDTWTDAEINAGENWRTRIDSAIREAFVLIVVVTPESKQSEYVTYEWSFAMGLGVPILPIILKNVEKLHPKLEELHYFNFTRPYEEPWADLVKQILNWYEGQTKFKIPDDAPLWAREAMMLLGHWNPAERELGLRALGRKKYLPALSAIIQLLRDDTDDGVREHALKALTNLGHSDAIIPILETIDENSTLFLDAMGIVYVIGMNTNVPKEALEYFYKYLQLSKWDLYSFGLGTEVVFKKNMLDLIKKSDMPEALSFIKEYERKEMEDANRFTTEYREFMDSNFPKKRSRSKSNNKSSDSDAN